MIFYNHRGTILIEEYMIIYTYRLKKSDHRSNLIGEMIHFHHVDDKTKLIVKKVDDKTKPKSVELYMRIGSFICVLSNFLAQSF